MAYAQNPEGWLLPGQYVRVRITQGELPAAMLIPQQAVTRSAQADTVLVVGADNKPGPRPVKIAGQHGEAWIVTGHDQPKRGSRIPRAIVRNPHRKAEPGHRSAPRCRSCCRAATTASAKR